MSVDDKDKKVLRSSIEDLVSMDLPDSIEVEINSDDVLDKPAAIKDDMYDQIRDKSQDRAIKTIDSLLKFYLSENIIEGEEYVRAKVEMHKLSLTKLIYLMETSEKAITILMRNISSSGNPRDRMFEVLGGLQKTLLDIIKSQTMFMVAAEEDIKRLSKNIELYGSYENEKKQIKTSNTVSARGTKDIIRAINAMPSSDEENMNE